MTMRASGIGCFLAAILAGCAPLAPVDRPSGATVAETPSRALAVDGRYISWREHRIDDEGVNGGVPVRGGDGLVEADIDRDGRLDIVSVHEDSNHLRIAFGTSDPDRWILASVAEGDVARAIEDVAAGDIDGDGWIDLVTASEEAHLAFFRNPGKRARDGRWPFLIPEITRGRGSWLRTFIADVDGDGRSDVLGANKGASDIVDPAAPRADRSTSLFTIAGDPLDDASWREQVLLRRDLPNTAMPVDIDGDGDIDILAAARLAQQAFLLVNTGTGSNGKVGIEAHPIEIDVGSSPCTVVTSAFQSDFADMDGNGRLDLVVGVIEDCGDPRAPNGLPALGWLRQPTAPDMPWRYHRIGDILPDIPIGIAIADFDGDGDPDVVTGGYSGLNIIQGGYSDAARDFDSPNVTPSSTVGRLAWFANPGTGGEGWVRHDISRRVRGMYDAFIARDMDGDGDPDLVTTRGNSGAFDGVIWLEQIRHPHPARAFTPARPRESAALPLPPPDWLDRYGTANTLTAPNKQ
ncbi:FG-GAP repeat domain-containing protein [Qipengyuania sp. MTN3-11]|uniref:FG-GAP repeat domain-containing protein n=1 Tax=Qipengyuania sp. MTN3-11 TaxID=3056557 RepID=UPI0036F35633